MNFYSKTRLTIKLLKLLVLLLSCSCYYIKKYLYGWITNWSMYHKNAWDINFFIDL